MIGSIVNSILIKSILLQPTLFLIKWAVNIWSSLTTKNVYKSGLKKILSWLSLLRVNDRVKIASFFRETKGAKLIIIVHVNSFFVFIDSLKINNCDCKNEQWSWNIKPTPYQIAGYLYNGGINCAGWLKNHTKIIKNMK